MAFSDINSITKGQIVAAMSVRSHYSRKFIEDNKNQLFCRRWLVDHGIYMSIGRITPCQSQTARSGDYTNKDDSSEEEEEATTSDEEGIVNDLVESDGEYVPSEESSDEEDDEMSD
jgi:hypothetical protein